MGKQPEALQIANDLEYSAHYPLVHTAAIELRRLHQVNQELVEALEAMVDSHVIPSSVCKDRPAYEKAIAILAKHKEQA